MTSDLKGEFPAEGFSPVDVFRKGRPLGIPTAILRVQVRHARLGEIQSSTLKGSSIRYSRRL